MEEVETTPGIGAPPPLAWIITKDSRGTGATLLYGHQLEHHALTHNRIWNLETEAAHLYAPPLKQTTDLEAGTTHAQMTIQ